MREIRTSILEDRFLPLYHEKRATLAEEDLDHPVTPPKRGSTTWVSEIGRYELHGSSIRQLETGAVLPATIREEIPELVRLLKAKDETPVIVLDDGLGAGAAALSAIWVYEALAQQQTVRPMHIVSLAEDLDALRLALTHKKIFPWLRHGAADTILHRGAWRSRFCHGLSWSLAKDEERPKPDLILRAAASGIKAEDFTHGCPCIDF
jgi:queuine tRNA-ribosyltransferase